MVASDGDISPVTRPIRSAFIAIADGSPRAKVPRPANFQSLMVVVVVKLED